MAKMDTIEAILKEMEAMDESESSSDSELRRSSQAGKKRSCVEISSQNNEIQKLNNTAKPGQQVFGIRKRNNQHGSYQPQYVSVEQVRF